MSPTGPSRYGLRLSLLHRIVRHARAGTLLKVLGVYYVEQRQQARHRRWLRYWKNGTAGRYQLDSRASMLLYPDDELSELIFSGQFELAERKLLAAYLRPGDVFLDIGANMGLYALMAASVVGSAGKVFAFEPCKLTHERLVRNIALNQFTNVQCLQAAISDREETRSLMSSTDGFAAWNSFARPAAGQAFIEEEVQCVTLDSFAMRNHLHGKVAMIKIDVEGWELRVLNGAERFLRSSDAPDLLVEFTEANARAAGTSCAAVYRRLEEYGYGIYAIDGRTRTLYPESLRRDYPYVNLVATKRPMWLSQRTRFGVASRITERQQR